MKILNVLCVVVMVRCGYVDVKSVLILVAIVKHVQVLVVNGVRVVINMVLVKSVGVTVENHVVDTTGDKTSYMEHLLEVMANFGDAVGK